MGIPNTKPLDGVGSPCDNSFIPTLDEVTSPDCKQIMDDVFTEENDYEQRRQTLETIRHLVKGPEIFTLVPQDRSFFEHLRLVCSDGSEFAFNKEAWKFLFQLVEFHEGVIEKMISLDVLSDFIELLACENKVVAHNARHYFSKMLTLPDAQFEELLDDEDPLQREHNVPEERVVSQYAQSIQHYQVFYLVNHKFTCSYDQGKQYMFMSGFYENLKT
jgi:hypothetical protein